MTKTIYTAIILAAIIGVSGCVDRAKQEQAKVVDKLVLDKTIHVAVADPSIKTLTQTLDITGNLTTADDVLIGAKQAGRITAIYVRDGDPVSAGQVIGEVDTTQLREQLRQSQGQLDAARATLAQAQSNKAYGPAKSSAAVKQAQAGVRSAEASLKKAKAGDRPEQRAQTQANLEAAKANRDIAKRDLDRKKALVDEGALARTSLDTAENTYAAAMQQYTNALQAELESERGNRPEDIEVADEAVRQAQDQLASARAAQKLDITLDQAVQNAQAQVGSAQASVDLARSNMADAVVRAPFSGRISGNPIQTGTVVSSGTTVAHLIGGEGAYFEGQIPEASVKNAKPGTPVSVTVDAVSGRTFQGYVAAVNPLGNQIGRFFTVRVMLKGDLAGLKSNMFAHGSLPVKTAANATVVPAEAVLVKNGKASVYTVENGKAKQIPVVQGVQVGDEQQIIGLPTGTKVIVKGQASVNDGDQVAIDNGQGTTEASK
jgi:RND family efflux transporter MFP subunit